MPGEHLRRNVLLCFAAIVGAVGIGEGILRLLTEPSDGCHGIVLGVELPPCRLGSPYEPVRTITTRSEPYGDLTVDGKRITVGDLWGIARYDTLIGFVPQENATSVNGWWRTDELGARVGRNAVGAAGTSVERVLVLGDSYAVGSRLPFDDTWSFALDRLSPELDVANFAMDGYGMTQAHLRYGSVRHAVEHDVVLVMFVPEADLWRDVNVRRDVGGDWDMYRVLPRYVLDGGDLRLIRSPFSDQGSGARPAAREETDRRLRQHLRTFDRFYSETWWREPAGTNRPSLYRLAEAVAHKVRLGSIRHNLMEPDSEAMRISATIFQVLAADARNGGRRFVLAVLPTERALIRDDERFWERWDRMIEAVCVDGSACLDLSAELREFPKEAIDRAYDGTHYGPRVNREIARILGEHLVGS